MSEQSCTACNDLREYAPEFVLNGTTDNVGDHLMANEGLSGARNHSDCDDLMDVNDCLIGNMVDELDAFDVCDWKDFMAEFIPNLYETIKAMVYSACGQWCAINNLYNGMSLGFGEDTTGNAYIVAGKGVSFLIPQDSSQTANDFTLNYIAGGLAIGTGSFAFFTSDFTDAGSCGNFDNDPAYRVSTSRKGNSKWGGTSITGFGELIAELRYKKSAYPMIKSWHQGVGQESISGPAFHVGIRQFDEGQWAWGQTGRCDANSGQAASSNYSDGHMVPTGWHYIQIRLVTCEEALGSNEGDQHSPRFWMGIRMNQDEISC